MQKIRIHLSKMTSRAKDTHKVMDIQEIQQIVRSGDATVSLPEGLYRKMPELGKSEINLTENGKAFRIVRRIILGFGFKELKEIKNHK